jgi:hypothetical protein
MVDDVTSTTFKVRRGGTRVTTGPFGIRRERGTVGRDNPLHHRAPAGEAGRVPTPQLWDETPLPSWSQLRRRLRDDPEVRAVLLAELGRHPATAGRLTGLRPYRTPTPQPSHSTWFAGTWTPDGTDVLVKINITPREQFWMAAASAAATGLVLERLHFGNAVFRAPPPGLTALLFDPIPRRQPWPFEPAYFEVLCGGSGLVAEMAAIRAGQGRPTCGPGDVGRLGVLYYGWMALLSWSVQPDKARRARLAGYVTAAARLDR